MPDLYSSSHTLTESHYYKLWLSYIEVEEAILRYLKEECPEYFSAPPGGNLDVDCSNVAGTYVTLTWEVEEDLMPKKQPIPGEDNA